MLTQWFDPEPGPARLPGVYARALIERGHQIRVLTGFPNYPSGRLFDGYQQRWRLDEQVSGVNVRRVPLYPSHDDSGAKRAMNYISFAASATSLAGNAFKGADVLWVYNSPVTVTAPALVHELRSRAPFLLHVQDLWPESVLESGMLRAGWVAATAKRAIEQVVRLAEHRAGAIAVIAPSLVDILAERGVDRRRIYYVPNPANEIEFEAASVRPATSQTAGCDGLNVMYAGSLGAAQGLETAVDAMRRLQHRKEIKLTVVGSGTAEAGLRAAARGLHNVEFTGRVPYDHVASLMRTADVQLVSLKNSTTWRRTVPSKIAAILAMGQPIIGSIAGDGARLITESGGGVVASPENPDALATAIEQFAGLDPGARAQLGETGRSYYERELSAGSAARKLESAFGDLLKEVY